METTIINGKEMVQRVIPALTLLQRGQTLLERLDDQ